MSEIKSLFVVYHIYDKIIDGIVVKESKRIGFFETEKQCVDVIEKFKEYVGFNDHHETCFKVFEYEFGKSYWRDEFISNYYRT